MRPDRFLARLEKRFLSFVVYSSNPDACTEWKGRTDKDGYGLIWVRENWRRASRIAWLLAHGVDPTNLVLHTCDNPPCTNERHLFEGTCQDNVDDKMQKGRWRGSAPYHGPRPKKPRVRKLTDEQVLAIRCEYKSAYGARVALAKRYWLRGTASAKVISMRFFQVGYAGELTNGTSRPAADRTP